MSRDRAKQLFAELRAAVPYQFVHEGCFQRAHVMAKMLEDAGVASEKEFVIPKKGDLRLETKYSELGYSILWFHTGVKVNVRQPDGRLEPWIMDPSVFDEPVPEAEWLKRMRPALKGVELDVITLPRFAYHLSDRDAPPSAWRDKDLAEAKSWNQDWREVKDWMVESKFLDHLRELEAHPVGA